MLCSFAVSAATPIVVVPTKHMSIVISVTKCHLRIAFPLMLAILDRLNFCRAENEFRRLDRQGGLDRLAKHFKVAAPPIL